MPGQRTCFQCGSVLIAEPTVATVDPPRMAGWKRPVRLFGRLVRATRVVRGPTISDRAAERLRVLFRAGLIAVILSAIPGLAHAVQRRFQSAALYVALWGLFVFGLLFFYGGFLGMAFLGLAIASHAWIAIHAGLLQEVSDLRYRLLAMGVVALCVVFLYRGAGRLILGDIMGGRVTQAVEFHGVRTGDYVLARRSLASRREHLTRGSLVLAPMSSVRGRFVRRVEHVLVAQIIALGGETLSVEQVESGQMRFVIDGEPLERDRYPVPGWLTRRDLSIIIPEGHCFLSTAYEARGYYGAENVASICVVSMGDIRAKAFVRWSPVWRRGFIREVE